MPDSDNWLSLRQAAERIGVHPTTLRRWADQGDIRVFRTPGGHRRFSESELAAFSRERLRSQIATGLEQLLSQRALRNTRAEIKSHQEEPWLSRLSDDQREKSRGIGRQLLGFALQYIVSDNGREVLEQTEALGRDYGRYNRSVGLTLGHVMRASMFFRDTLIDTVMELPESSSGQRRTTIHLVRRINQLMNVVQLALVEAYAEDA